MCGVTVLSAVCFFFVWPFVCCRLTRDFCSLEMDSDDLSCSECESPSHTDGGGKEAVHYGVKKFSASQLSKLNQLYWSGMKGVGKQYQQLLLEATLSTSLSMAQVKVSNHRLHMDLINLSLI